MSSSLCLVLILEYTASIGCKITCSAADINNVMHIWFLQIFLLACRYDRRCIEDWLAQGHSVCPVSDKQLQEPVTIVSNVNQRKKIEEWFRKRLPHGLVRLKRPHAQAPQSIIHINTYLFQALDSYLSR